MIVQGFVGNVTTEVSSTVLMSWVGNELQVPTAAGFPPSGQFILGEDSSVIYNFTQTSPIDEFYDVITTVESAPAGVTADTLVSVWPLDHTKMAEVFQYDGGDGIPCVVPHALDGYLPEGTRELTINAESVEIEEVNGTWYVRNITGQRPQLAQDTVSGLSDALSELDDRLNTSADALAQAKADLAAADQATADELTQARTELAAADQATNNALTQAQQELNAADLQLHRSVDAAAQAASQADSKATTAQSTADGKNTVTTSTSAPTAQTPGKAVGDVWFQLVGANIVGAWTWTALGWVARPIDSQAIANLDVGKLTASSASITSVVAQKLAADFGTFRVLTADKLVVGSTTNLISNGALEWGDARNWDTRLQSGYQTTDVPTGYPAAITYSGGTISPSAIPGDIPVTPGQELLFECWLKADVDGSRLFFEFRNQSGTLVAPWVDVPTGTSIGSYPLYNQLVPTTWTKYQRRLTVPAGVTRIRVATVYFNHPNGTVTNANVSVAGVTLRVQSSGELIVDGAVTAAKVAAGAIVAGKLSADAVTASNIAAGAVTAGKIATDAVTANTIAANAVTADKVAANAITADKLNVDEALAQKLDAVLATFQTVFAKSITADMMDLDTLNGKVLNGVDIYSPNQAATPRVHLGNSVFEVIRKPDPEAPEVATVSLGGATSDQLTIGTGSGDPGATINADGSATFRGNVSVQGDIYMNGSTDSLPGWLAKNYAQGYLTGGQLVNDSSHFGSGELGLLGLDTKLSGSSIYKISLGGWLRTASASTVQLSLKATKNADTVAPTVNSQTYGSWVFPLTAGSNSVSGSFYLMGDGSTYRFLLSGKNLSGNIESWLYAGLTWPFQLVIEHVGFDPSALGNGYRNDGGGTPFANAAPAAPATPTRVTQTKEYTASTVSFRAGTKVTDGTLQQGNYGGAQRYSYAVVPQQMLDDISGSTVKSVEVQLSNMSWYYGSGGSALISIWGGALPTTQPAITGNTVQTVSGWARGATKWVNIAGAGPVQNWAGGSYKGIVLGEGAGTNQLYYGKFSPTVKFRVTYVK